MGPPRTVQTKSAEVAQLRRTLRFAAKHTSFKSASFVDSLKFIWVNLGVTGSKRKLLPQSGRCLKLRLRRSKRGARTIPSGTSTTRTKNAVDIRRSAGNRQNYNSAQGRSKTFRRIHTHRQFGTGACSFRVGYITGYALAADNLRLGLSVVADSVNPLRITRDAWRDVAVQEGVDYLEVEIICSDTEQHRERVEGRSPDIPGLVLPDWQSVVNRKYEPWDREHLVLDTAKLQADAAVSEIFNALGGHVAHAADIPGIHALGRDDGKQ